MNTQPSILERLFSLQDKTILITGAGGGIGQILAVALTEAGATLGLHDIALERLSELQCAGDASFLLIERKDDRH